MTAFGLYALASVLAGLGISPAARIESNLFCGIVAALTLTGYAAAVWASAVMTH